MTTTGSSSDKKEEKPTQSTSAAAETAARQERSRWMNDPETIHSMSDVIDPEGTLAKLAKNPGEKLSGSAFCLTEGENVIASKATAQAESSARDKTGANDPSDNASTDQLLLHWSGQKAARKGKGNDLQEEILRRIRSEIELEIEQIKEENYSVGVTLILIARAFGKDPRQWLPADKISNLFIEAVIYSAGMDLPWDLDSIPDYAELKFILGEDSRCSRVFRADKLRPKESATAFSLCPVEDGDIALWTNPALRLSGLIERAEGGQHNILSAGCVDSPSGFIYTTLDFFMQAYAAGSPVPDVVYRINRLKAG